MPLNRNINYTSGLLPSLASRFSLSIRRRSRTPWARTHLFQSWERKHDRELLSQIILVSVLNSQRSRTYQFTYMLSRKEKINTCGVTVMISTTSTKSVHWAFPWFHFHNTLTFHIFWNSEILLKTTIISIIITMMIVQSDPEVWRIINLIVNFGQEIVFWKKLALFSKLMRQDVWTEMNRTNESVLQSYSLKMIISISL